MNKSTGFHGYILFSPDQSAQPPDILPSMAPFFEHVRTRDSGWSDYKYHVQKDPSLKLDRPPERLTEPVIWRGDSRSPRCLIASGSKFVADHILRRIVNVDRVTPIRPVSLATRRLVSLIAGTYDDNSMPREPERCANYRITALSNRLTTAGTELRTMLLYGKDITASKVFQDYHGSIDPYLVGIRLQSSYDEVMRVGNDGYVSFFDSNRNSLPNIEACLKLFYEEGLYD